MRKDRVEKRFFPPYHTVKTENHCKKQKHKQKQEHLEKMLPAIKKVRDDL
jgi:hypothetical protein